MFLVKLSSAFCIAYIYRYETCFVMTVTMVFEEWHSHLPPGFPIIYLYKDGSRSCLIKEHSCSECAPRLLTLDPAVTSPPPSECTWATRKCWEPPAPPEWLIFHPPVSWNPHPEWKNLSLQSAFLLLCCCLTFGINISNRYTQMALLSSLQEILSTYGQGVLSGGSPLARYPSHGEDI